jgi:hypothetical protein
LVTATARYTVTFIWSILNRAVVYTHSAKQGVEDQLGLRTIRVRPHSTEAMKNSDMQGTSDDDRILYWPTVLAVFWLLLSAPRSSGPGDLIPEPFLTLVCPVMSAFIAGLLCVGWIYQRAWRRLLSTMILPLSVVLMVYLIDSPK